MRLGEVKYRAVHDRAWDDRAAAIADRERSWFEAASQAYERHHLWHRAPSDGYFARRVPEGLLVTATKTSKIGLDLTARPPASCATRAPTFHHRMPSKRRCCLPRARRCAKRSTPTRATGSPVTRPTSTASSSVSCPTASPLGRSLSDALDVLTDGFVIMEEHGEVFVAGDGHPFSDAIDAIDYFCQAEPRLASARVAG